MDIPVEQFLEFIRNHPLLIGAFVVTLGMIVFVELQRRMGGGKEITPSAAVRMQNDDGLFIDVRDLGEYKSGHLLNAKHIALKELRDRLHEIDKHKDKPVIAYCANGMRAAKACGILVKSGFTQVFSIAGGLAAWEKANLPVEKK